MYPPFGRENKSTNSVSPLIGESSIEQNSEKMELCEIIKEVKNTQPYENLNALLGPKLGGLIYELVESADKADKELDVVHGCITDLYDAEINTERIKKALDEIEELTTN